MEQFVIKGGTSLRGEVEIGGAKNAALAILAASIMTDETVMIENLPDVRDINVLLEAMQDIGAIVERMDRHTVKINGSQYTETQCRLRVYQKDPGVLLPSGRPSGKIQEGRGSSSGRLQHRKPPHRPAYQGLPGAGGRCGHQLRR